MIKKDILRTYDLVNGNKFRKIIGCYRSPGVHAIVIFRFGAWLKKRNLCIKTVSGADLYFVVSPNSQ